MHCAIPAGFIFPAISIFSPAAQPLRLARRIEDTETMAIPPHNLRGMFVLQLSLGERFWRALQRRRAMMLESRSRACASTGRGQTRGRWTRWSFFFATACPKKGCKPTRKKTRSGWADRAWRSDVYDADLWREAAVRGAHKSANPCAHRTADGRAPAIRRVIIGAGPRAWARRCMRRRRDGRRWCWMGWGGGWVSMVEREDRELSRLSEWSGG